ncbi:MAG: hypothetical protein LBJ08_02720 [Bifidobacteriaceae bacterium]|jgi:hypothetical protein|nr:hypothetical protein [Bifidobacteriaceae bacterium]
MDTTAAKLPQPRPVPSWVRPGVAPDQAMADLLRRHRDEQAAAAAATEAAWARADALAAHVGMTLTRKQAAMSAAEFRVLGDLLEAEHIEVLNHVGEPLTPELEEFADIVEWVDDDGPPDSIDPALEEWVAEAFEPEIRFEGRLVHRAVLSCARRKDPAGDKEAPETLSGAAVQVGADAAGADGQDALGGVPAAAVLDGADAPRADGQDALGGVPLAAVLDGADAPRADGQDALGGVPAAAVPGGADAPRAGAGTQPHTWGRTGGRLRRAWAALTARNHTTDQEGHHT